jgi:hypothetical protein
MTVNEKLDALRIGHEALVDSLLRLTKIMIDALQRMDQLEYELKRRTNRSH